MSNVIGSSWSRAILQTLLRTTLVLLIGSTSMILLDTSALLPFDFHKAEAARPAGVEGTD